MTDKTAVSLTRDDLHSFVEKYTQELAAERQARHEELVGFGQGLNVLLTKALDFGIGLATEASKVHVAADVASQEAHDRQVAAAEVNRHRERMFELETERKEVEAQEVMDAVSSLARSG